MKPAAIRPPFPLTSRVSSQAAYALSSNTNASGREHHSAIRASGLRAFSWASRVMRDEGRRLLHRDEPLVAAAAINAERTDGLERAAHALLGPGVHRMRPSVNGLLPCSRRGF